MELKHRRIRRLTATTLVQWLDCLPRRRFALHRGKATKERSAFLHSTQNHGRSYETRHNALQHDRTIVEHSLRGLVWREGQCVGWCMRQRVVRRSRMLGFCLLARLLC